MQQVRYFLISLAIFLPFCNGRSLTEIPFGNGISLAENSEKEQFLVAKIHQLLHQLQHYARHHLSNTKYINYEAIRMANSQNFYIRDLENELEKADKFDSWGG